MKIDTKGVRMITLTGLLLTGILLTSGCVQQGLGLEDMLWKLESYVNSEGNLVSVLADTEITAQFENGMVGGSSGCNTYSADYQINGIAITIGTIIKTLMYCTEPRGVMDQENDYLTALASVTSYEMTANTVEMTNASGEVVLAFKAYHYHWDYNSYLEFDSTAFSKALTNCDQAIDIFLRFGLKEKYCPLLPLGIKYHQVIHCYN